MADIHSMLDKIVQPMREPVGEFARLVREMAGDNAKGLTLFGAIAAGTFDASRHTVRSVLVLGGMDLILLRRLAEHGAKLGKHRIAAPLVMTPNYINDSLDTFPLELLEISQMHVTLFGEDHFDALSFDAEHIRLQCERELKSVLIGMRQGLLAAAGRDKALEAVELDVAEALLRTLRGMLWAKGKKDTLGALQVVSAIESTTDRELTGIRSTLDPAGPHGWAQFESLYRDVEGLAEVANA